MEWESRRNMEYKTNSNLTDENIHSIRYADYEKIKSFTKEELIEKTNKSAEIAIKKIQAIKNNN